MHCLVFTDTDLYSLTKGKSYLAKQKWRRSTCLRDQCYDVGCHPCIKKMFRTTFFLVKQGSKIALICSCLGVPRAAGNVEILILLMKINSFPYRQIFLVMQGNSLF